MLVFAITILRIIYFIAKFSNNFFIKFFYVLRYLAFSEWLLFGLASFCGLRVVDDFRCRNGLPLTGVVGRLHRFWGSLPARDMGHFRYSKIYWWDNFSAFTRLRCFQWVLYVLWLSGYGFSPKVFHFSVSEEKRVGEFFMGELV